MSNLTTTLATVLFLLPAFATGAEAEGGYRVPAKEIVDLVDAPPTPAVAFSSDHRWMAILERPSLPPIAELAEKELRLAGLRMRARTNGPSRDSFFRSITFRFVADGTDRPVTGLPTDARIGDVSWAPDGARLSFTLTEASGISLWVAEVSKPKARKLTAPDLNAAYGAACSWLADSKTQICRLIPAARGAAPIASEVPSGPIVQQSLGKKAPARTYQDLLKSPHDEAMLDHMLSTQVTRIELDGRATAIGAPGTILIAAPSTDDQWLLVYTLHRPYSYKTPIDRFPKRIEVWDLAGRKIAGIADQPLAEEIPISFGAVRTGPREMEWRADAPATLCWAEARDGGDPRTEAAVRDELLCLDAPFTGKPRGIVQLALRYGGVQWGSDSLALVNEWWWADRKTRTWVVAPGKPDVKPAVLWDRSSEDRYGDPGTPATRLTPQGTVVLHTTEDGSALYLLGEGASPEGDRPFLDRLDLNTKKASRLWRSEAPYYEFVTEILDDEARRIITRRESPNVPPNYFLKELVKKGLPKALTKFPHPTPQLAGVKKQLIRYKRKDGVGLTATVYLPPAYDPKKSGPLPTVFWVYPAEFKSADAAGQVNDSPHRFVRVSWSSPLYLLTQGYAVVDDPTIPIVGEGKTEPNDTYVEQLVSGLEAAVDEAVRLGIADRDRLAIGGHSYGAFTTANALAHTDLFRAGIARSGAYNRTLTPFSFQSEERSMWEAPEVYIKLSPLMNAQRIDEPLLLVHGEADANAGTFPMQSERLFEAMKGLGGNVRLVILPHESHGYRARESALHLLWEQTAWLDAYVKNAPPRKQAELKPAP